MQLTLFEKSELDKHEAIIEHGLKTFVDVGRALLSIRDSKLYRNDYSTFENYCRDRWGMTRRSANRMIAAHGVVENLGPMGPSPNSERQARPLTQLPPVEQPAAWQRAQEIASDNGKMTAAVVQQAVDEIKPPHVSRNSGQNEWYTPSEFIEAARVVMGSIDIDPASSDIANEIVKATTHHTIETNGLDKNWHGNVWMNPPYAQPAVKHFSEKLAVEYHAGNILQACVLVNNATETGWFRMIVQCAAAVCFPAGRIKFLDIDGNPGAPLQGQAIIYIGNNVNSFADKFGIFGTVLYV